MVLRSVRYVMRRIFISIYSYNALLVWAKPACRLKVKRGEGIRPYAPPQLATLPVTKDTPELIPPLL